ncbi:unnamed protein product [Amoebophrya sp. A25]|nr:unnamed protein product [Amoebophrya sp. A25]|eukprot:GSA25T00000739001.1
MIMCCSAAFSSGSSARRLKFGQHRGSAERPHDMWVASLRQRRMIMWSLTLITLHVILSIIYLADGLQQRRSESRKRFLKLLKKGGTRFRSKNPEKELENELIPEVHAHHETTSGMGIASLASDTASATTTTPIASSDFLQHDVEGNGLLDVKDRNRRPFHDNVSTVTAATSLAPEHDGDGEEEATDREETVSQSTQTIENASSVFVSKRPRHHIYSSRQLHGNLRSTSTMIASSSDGEQEAQSVATAGDVLRQWWEIILTGTSAVARFFGEHQLTFSSTPSASSTVPPPAAAATNKKCTNSTTSDLYSMNGNRGCVGDDAVRTGNYTTSTSTTLRTTDRAVRESDGVTLTTSRSSDMQAGAKSVVKRTHFRGSTPKSTHRTAVVGASSLEHEKIAGSPRSSGSAAVRTRSQPSIDHVVKPDYATSNTTHSSSSTSRAIVVSDHATSTTTASTSSDVSTRPSIIDAGTTRGDRLNEFAAARLSFLEREKRSSCCQVEQGGASSSEESDSSDLLCGCDLVTDSEASSSEDDDDKAKATEPAKPKKRVHKPVEDTANVKPIAQQSESKETPKAEEGVHDQEGQKAKPGNKMGKALQAVTVLAKAKTRSKPKKSPDGDWPRQLNCVPSGKCKYSGEDLGRQFCSNGSRYGDEVRQALTPGATCSDITSSFLVRSKIMETDQATHKKLESMDEDGECCIEEGTKKQENTGDATSSKQAHSR